MRRLAFPVLVLALLAACGEVPQPFRHDGPVHSLARPKMPRGITIRPVEDKPELADALIKALATHEVPATKSSGPAFGHVLEAVPAAGGLQWMLIPPGGEPAPVYGHAVPTDPHALRRAAEETATALSHRLADPDALPPPGKAVPRRPSLKLAQVHGLPGDGNTALTTATRRALERSGFPLADEADYVVEARAAVTPLRPDEELLVLTWVVKDKGGKEIASISQEGAVPKGRLSTPWGGLARDIAEGSAAGIIQVVATASRKQ
jgi:hypothetical protein